MTAVEEVLNKYGYEIARNWQFDLDNAVTSGNLRDSIYFDVITNDQGTSLVLYAEDYWKFVEQGRSPGKQPPQEKMLEFVQKKNIMPKPYQLKSGKSVLPTQKQLAFLIGRKIGKEGIKARPYLQENIYDAIVDLEKDLTEAYYKDTEKELNFVFNDLRNIKR